MNWQIIEDELTFTTSRSGGSGGQHINKVETKVTLYFSVMNSSELTQDQKDLLTQKLANKINKEGFLILSHDRKRSQLKNKEAVVAKFKAMVSKALTPRKKRKKTNPSKATIEAARKQQQHRKKIKALRKKPKFPH